MDYDYNDRGTKYSYDEITVNVPSNRVEFDVLNNKPVEEKQSVKDRIQKLQTIDMNIEFF